MELPDHLGGHMNKTHIDYGALLYMREKLYCRTMIDVGCGPGGQVRLAAKLGYDTVVGIDGDWTVLPEQAHPTLEIIGESTDVGRENDGQKESPFFFIHDFTEKKWTPFYQPYIPDRFDLTWSVEFLEHVEEKYMDNYMSCFTISRYAIVTFAPPGHDGHHHVNCQHLDYWVDKFGEYDMIYNEALTEEVRKASTMKKPFMQNRGVVFEKRSKE